ncbi:hypothetical protein F1880_007526 [Penicillium rolfsii]|nr:hypothetical protein F1880_007526 [Penicillium rolfsii]
MDLRNFRRLARTDSEESLLRPISVMNLDRILDDEGAMSLVREPTHNQDLAKTCQPKPEQSKDGKYDQLTKQLDKVHFEPKNTAADIDHTLHTLTMRLKRSRELLPKREPIAGKPQNNS